MEDIKTYLEGLGQTGGVLEMQLKKYYRNPEIMEEFQEWILKGKEERFPDKVEFQGYRASDIAKMAPFMNGSGVYSFLVTLKEKPDDGLRIINEGFVLR